MAARSTGRALSLGYVHRRSLWSQRRESTEPITTKRVPKQPAQQISPVVAFFRLIRNKAKIIVPAVVFIAFIAFVAVPALLKPKVPAHVLTYDELAKDRHKHAPPKPKRKLDPMTHETAGLEQRTWVPRSERIDGLYPHSSVRPDGLKLVYDDELHPIFALMERAQLRWDNLQAKQSKTFAEAVTEYSKRYGRAPPKGFDQWYAFARMSNVHLIDEFDLIEKDLNPFRAFSGESFRKRLARSEELTPYGWGLEVKDGVLTRTGEQAEHSRAHGTAKMTERFVHKLDDVKLLYYSHDTAKYLIPWEERDRLEKLAENNQLDDDANLDLSINEPNYESTPIKRGLHQSCHPRTHLRSPDIEYGSAKLEWTGKEMPDLPRSDKRGHKAISSVIDSFKQTLDQCNLPKFRHYHSGSSLPDAPGTQLLPLIVGGPAQGFADIYGPIAEQFDMLSGLDVAWENRANSAAVWRGQTSGPTWHKLCAWRSTQRARIHLFSHDMGGNRTVVFCGEDGMTYQKTMDNAKLNTAFLDAGMVGPAVQCVQEDGTCDEMEALFNGYDKHLSIEDAEQYRYAMDIDGNSWSGRFRRLMLSQAAVIKTTIYQEYWTDWAIPWLHFIPVQVDYSDLWDVLAFFRGDDEGKDGHEELGRRIAMAGRDWAQKHMRWEDIEAYQYRLMLEWARLQNRDQKNMDFVGPIDQEPVWT